MKKIPGPVVEGGGVREFVGNLTQVLSQVCAEFGFLISHQYTGKDF